MTLQQGDGQPTKMVQPLVTEFMEAQQRIGELESKLAQREQALRQLRRRLRDLEQPHWERQTKLDDNLAAALWKVSELEGKLGSSFDTDYPASAYGRFSAQAELDAIKATKLWRYSYPIRVRYYLMRRSLRVNRSART